MGAIYLIDKGYVDFSRLFNIIHKNGAFFVTRAKDNMQYEVVNSMPVDKQTGVISDEIVRLTKESSKQKYPEELRMVVYEDFATGNVYRFITNHLGYEALTIAELYREMERGTFLQMDKATSAYQVVLRNLRECCLYTNLDSSLCIPVAGYSQEAHAY